MGQFLYNHLLLAVVREAHVWITRLLREAKQEKDLSKAQQALGISKFSEELLKQVETGEGIAEKEKVEL